MTTKFSFNRKLKRTNKRRSPSRNFRSRQGATFWQSLKQAVGRLSPSWQACLPLASIIVLLWGVAAVAQSPPPAFPEDVTDLAQQNRIALDTMWVVVAAILVIFMNAGFGMLETGFCRQKNAVNILSKNLIVFALATVAFWAIGFGLMFGDGTDFVGMNGFFLAGPDNSPAMEDAYEGVFSSLSWTGVPLAAKFLFQVAFAGTAATIVSGAVAERIKFVDFLIFSLLLVGIAYPITGHWVWGGGWLGNMGFKDFAGSTVVHSVGGWAALTGAYFLGPRLGKYQEGRPSALPGHNMSIATLGCLILWIGWFGFNPGSTMAVNMQIAHIAVTTNIAAATGGIAATIVAWVYLGKPDLSMIINGILAGLVAITAGCDGVSVIGAAIIGAIGGVLVVFSVTFFDRMQIDDPVGATSVHLVNGAWGTFAVGLFNIDAGLFYTGGVQLLGTQLLGIATIGLMTVLVSTIFWVVLKSTLGIRVEAEEELKGLDISEHGMEAYSGFLKDTGGMPRG
ncbi:ammonium transporter [Oxynema aestuarii]|jgi:Amt family ammonium transporter|uniref:Ammonium transporter n=1 Tax=Oxynema aestuarii AP17 TaxID=2064643 RepID=A0A6H1U3I1_9CYAN|nr:ammonium transporter [Oxynema aestuarii]QIZ72593.1 ammonium transporter [Oxynema aestuarii AP17]RMH75993.1 MAG: ammonium transporter [Cyanobacteria bacterium J007]